MYPIIKPSLNLDFANVRRLDPRITFTRTTTATYFDAKGVLRTAEANVPRFDHNPVTGESLGLLIEGRSENFYTYSEQFDNADWIKENATITANAETAPDGTVTMDKLTYSLGLNGYITRYVNFVAGTPKVISYFAKAAERDNFTTLVTHTPFGGTGGVRYVNFNLTAQTATPSSQGDVFGEIEHVGNGIFRCSATFIPKITVAVGPQIGRSVGVGNGTDGIFIWGAQNEDNELTSYIKTEGSQKTRAADSAEMTGTNFSSWYNAVEGTLFAHADTADVANSRVSAMIFDGTTSNRIHTNANQFAGFISAAGVTQLSIPVASVVRQNNVMSKTAIAFATNSGNAAVNGTIGTLDTSLTVPVVNQVRLGGISTENSNINGHIRRVAYYPRRLSDSELQALTA